MKLYEIAHELNQAIELYNSVETDEQLAELEKTLSDLSLSFQDKVVGVALYILNTEADSVAVKAEIDRLATLKNRADKKAEWLRNYLKANMEATGNLEVDGTKVKIKIRKNPPAVTVEDEFAVPDTYKRTKTIVEIDKTAIKEAHKAGVGVAGTKVTQGTRLEIK
jgi:phage host-nuclease inhibitor protein Gam